MQEQPLERKGRLVQGQCTAAAQDNLYSPGDLRIERNKQIDKVLVDAHCCKQNPKKLGSKLSKTNMLIEEGN